MNLGALLMGRLYPFFTQLYNKGVPFQIAARAAQIYHMHQTNNVIIPK